MKGILWLGSALLLAAVSSVQAQSPDATALLLTLPQCAVGLASGRDLLAWWCLSPPHDAMPKLYADCGLLAKLPAHGGHEIDVLAHQHNLRVHQCAAAG